MSEETKDGGPAFPIETTATPYASGMSLRDWFAGQALTNPYTAHDGDADKVAEWAYQVADAMIFVKSNRIGTQVVRDLEAKLAKAVEALQQLVIEYDEIDLAYDEPKSMTAAYGVALATLAELTGSKE